MSVDPVADTTGEPAALSQTARRKHSSEGRSQGGTSKLSAALGSRRSSSPATITIINRFFKRSPSEAPSIPTRRGTKPRTQPARTHQREQGRDSVSPSTRSTHSTTRKQGRDSVSPCTRSTKRKHRKRHLPLDTSDTSDVWRRRSTKEKVSLRSMSLRAILHDVEPPWFVRFLFGRHGAKRDKRKKSRKRSGEHSPRRRRVNGSSGRRRRRATPRRTISSPTPAANLSADDTTVASDTREPTVQFVHPLDDSTQHIPKHMVIEEIARARASSILQLAQVQHKPHRRNDPSAQGADAGADEGQLRIYRVLGRKPGCRDLSAKVDDRLAPVLVTIARDGSIISDTTSRPSEDLGNCRDQSSLQQKLPRNPSPVRMPEPEPKQPDNVGSAESPGVSSMAADSAGAESFATARLFTGSLSPEPMPTHMTMPMPMPMPMHDEPLAEYSGSERSADTDEVSDIAMREHLDVSAVDRDAADTFDAGDSFDADRAFARWLTAQAAVNDHPDAHPVTSSIAQAVAHMSFPMPPRHTLVAAASLPHIPLSDLTETRQRHYSPSMATTAGAAPTPSFARAVGSEHGGLLEGLLARVDGLEARFGAVESVLAGFGRKLDVLLSSVGSVDSAQSPAARMAAAAASSLGVSSAIRSLGQK